MRDLTGLTYGRLAVVRLGADTKDKKRTWECLCVCGNSKAVRERSLLSGDTKSCGCLSSELSSKRNSLPEGEAALRQFYNSYVQGAKGRGLSFSLTLLEFKALVSSCCHYCGSPPDKWAKSLNKNNRMNGNVKVTGVDRKDNAKGYELGNCLSCCSVCNFAKHSMTYEAFIQYLDRLTCYRSTRNAALPRTA